MHEDERRYDEILNAYDEIVSELSMPETSRDNNRMIELSRKRNQLQPLVEKIREIQESAKQKKALKDQISLEKDSELKNMLLEEIDHLEQSMEHLEEDIKILMLPQDPDSGKNVFVEIRAGTGGEEAALFAADLYKMYTRFMESNKIPYEVMDIQETGLKGFKEVVFLVKGEQAYNYFHFEKGTHRVQRIPETESGGRIHTSAVTVAVVPEADEQEMVIEPNELRIDVYRSSGPGGQSVNTTDSAVRVTHIPTGLVVSCQDEKSQHKNKAKALRILNARLQEKIKEESHEKMSAEKKMQIGSGDRSEKIRTYNFPQNRLTDHRIHFTSHNLDGILAGNMDDLFQALFLAEKEIKLKSAGGF